MRKIKEKIPVVMEEGNDDPRSLKAIDLSMQQKQNSQQTRQKRKGRIILFVRSQRETLKLFKERNDTDKDSIQ